MTAYTSEERALDRRIRTALFFRPGSAPRARYVLGRIEARLAFNRLESFTVNVFPVNSVIGPTRFCRKADKAGPGTLYRIRVKPKKGFIL